MTTLNFILERILAVCLFFLLGLVPLLVNPTALDYWYQPKIQSVYGLVSIIIAAVILRYFFFRVSISLKEIPVKIFLLAYCCSAVISTALSIDRHISLKGDVWRYEGLFTLLSYAVLLVIFSALVESRRQAESLMKALLASAFLAALYGIVQYLGFNPTRHFIEELNIENVIGSTIGNGNFFGKFLVLTGPLFAGYCLYKNTKKIWIMCSIALMSVLIALVLSMARASWLGFACAGLLLSMMVFRHGAAEQKKKIAVFWAAAAASLVILAALAATGLGSFSIAGKLADKTDSAINLQEGRGSATRLFIWGKAVPLLQKRPWFGYGPDTHEKVYSTFRTEYFKRFNVPGIIDRAHNNYIDIAIAQGLFGLFSYCGIVISFLVWLWRAIATERDVRLRMLFCAIFSSYCGYLINDIFSFSVVSVSPTLWSVMGLTVSLRRWSTGSVLNQPAAGRSGI